MRTVTSVSGIVMCECQTGEYMDSNGECTTRSEYFAITVTTLFRREDLVRLPVLPPLKAVFRSIMKVHWVNL